MKNKNGKFLYVELADRIQGQIEKGAFRLSEKLPSLRALCQKTGYSMTTVFQAYVELEKRGVVESRHRSGYFIKASLERLRHPPGMQQHEMVPKRVNLDDLIHQLTEDMGSPGILKLGSVAVAPVHLPFKSLHKHLKSIPKKQIANVIAGYAHPQGDARLRQQISNLLFPIIPWISMEDIIVTNGCTDALSLSLKAVSSPQDTVIVESPTDPWLRQTIKDSGMYALEIPTDPHTGLDLQSVERILEQEKIAACFVNPNCQNPLGFIMPDDRKKKLLDLLGNKSIPIIENDVCGDLYFGEHRPNPIKKWDTNGSVLYCSSFSKVLAPGLRVGWVIPGRFKEPVLRMKLNRSLISPTLNQALVANYLKEGTYYRHLRKLRGTIKLQHRYCTAAINKHFPEKIKMTSPSGGQSIWIELPRGVNGREVYYKVKKEGISILPGFLCTSFNIFDEYIRIGYGGEWDKSMEQAIKTIGDIIKSMVKQKNS